MEPTALNWIKSKRSGPYSDNCVELALDEDGSVWLRSSKDPEGPRIKYTPAEIEAFIGGAKDGDFDHLI